MYDLNKVQRLMHMICWFIGLVEAALKMSKLLNGVQMQDSWSQAEDGFDWSTATRSFKLLWFFTDFEWPLLFGACVDFGHRHLL